MTKAHKIVFFGNERLATAVSTTAPTLRALVEDNYEVKAVVTNWQRATSRNQRELEIETLATSFGIPVLKPDKLSDARDTLAELGADIGVLVAYGKIVSDSIIDLFPGGIINIHPSLLPAHRGPIPVESVILSGEPETGVSIMKLVRDMDAGPIYDQAVIKLSGKESKQDLADKLIALGASRLRKILPGVLSGKLQAQAQDDSRAAYDQKLTKSHGQILWDKPAVELAREIRAYLGWPGSKCTLLHREVTITAAHAGDTACMGLEAAGTIGEAYKTANGELAVATGDGELIIDLLKPSGKREMSGIEYWAGHHTY